MGEHEHHHNYVHAADNSQRTLLVILVTLATMVAEVTYGFLTNSMALLSDGWHMGTHALALGITFVAYWYIKKIQQQASVQADVISQKVSSLAGYTSSLFLLLSAIWIVFESMERFFKPLQIEFNEAILVASIGLFVNIICILIMEHGHDKKAEDYNYKAAYLHILTDVMTSVFAIVALVAGKYLGWVMLDPIIVLLGGLVILKWSEGLIKDTTKILLDAREINMEV